MHHSIMKSALFVVVLSFLSLAGGCATLSHSPSSSYSGIAALYARCGVPGPCEHPLRCEGEMVEVTAKVDYHNVFDRTRFPSLPYEKFMLIDDKGAPTLDVWTVAPDNRAIFAKLLEHREPAADRVLVRGRIKGVDMPMMGACQRGIKLELGSAEGLSFVPMD
jgi:hypothetical protein